ncbi:MAG: hypothetical protein KVP17_001891 [Porospora cf. gigantea B]|uniref:uncharacterized protein n=1 Tax=Porospora cf. gigantea B TaxID=2853592 RepID=UPI003571A9C3|nr:MAG: hypothetical protein KVP17_001891 [Porospora cf. gigantea B]
MTRFINYFLISLALARFNAVHIPPSYRPKGMVWRKVQSGGRVPVGDECRPEVRLVHVQDATDGVLVQNLRENKVVESLLKSLKSDYGELQYGLSTFADKPGPLTGFGMGYSVWEPEWNGGIVTDKCYTNQLPMHSAGTSTEIWKDFVVSGGKDAEENQLDALARAAVDPEHWPDNATHNDEGQPIARLALMVTDGFAHHGVKNDHGVFGFNVTLKGSISYWNSQFGDLEEDLYDYRIKSDFMGAYLRIPYGPEGAEVEVMAGNVYEAFLICKKDQPDTAEYRRETLESLVKAGVDVKDVTPFNDSQISNWWLNFCNHEMKQNSAKEYTGVFRFVNKYSPLQAVGDYPYTDVAFDGSDRCSTYEYPNTGDSRYASMFKKNNVVPIGLVVPLPTYKPLPTYPSDDDEYQEYLYRVRVWGIMQNHCPIVRKSCPSKWINDCILDGPFLWDRNTIETKLAECYDEHYEMFFSNLEKSGVASVYQRLDAGDLVPCSVTSQQLPQNRRPRP